MTRSELNELLQEYAYAAQRYHRDNSPYGGAYDTTPIEGDQDPAVYDTIEPKLWAAINPYNRAQMGLLAHRYNHDPMFHSIVDAIVAHIYALSLTTNDVRDAAAVADMVIKESEQRNRVEKVKYVCGCEAAGDNIAATCPVHGYPIDTPIEEADLTW